MFGAPLDLPRWLAWRSAPCPGPPSPRRRRASARSRSPRTSSPSSMPMAGSSTTSRRSAETHNLAADHRARLIEMIALWYVEAGKYNVLPLDSRGTARFADERPELDQGARRLRLLSGHAERAGERRGQGAQPEAHDHRRSRHSRRRCRGCPALPRQQHRRLQLFLHGGKLHYVHNYVGVEEFHIASNEAVPDGRVTLRYTFEPTASPTSPTARARRAGPSSFSAKSRSERESFRSPSRC